MQVEIRRRYREEKSRHARSGICAPLYTQERDRINPLNEVLLKKRVERLCWWGRDKVASTEFHRA